MVQLRLSPRGSTFVASIEQEVEHVVMLYHPEANGKRVELNEAWHYDPSYNRFILLPKK